MQLLLLAPRVLRDISADNIIPITNRLGFHISNARGLPVRAIALSMLIALPFIFVPSLVWQEVFLCTYCPCVLLQTLPSGLYGCLNMQQRSVSLYLTGLYHDGGNHDLPA